MCTGMKLHAKDGSLVHGRTLEFGIPIDTSIAFIPRGYEFNKGPGMVYKAKYGAVGGIAYDEISLLDGMNEKGLSAGAFYFPGFAQYSELKDPKKALSPLEFINWLLTQFATVEEVQSALESVEIVPTVSKYWGLDPAPLHYIVYDKSGKCLVIEPVEGSLRSYENPIGVLTNSPALDWHLTNLRNYVFLDVNNRKPLQIKGVEIDPLGQGSGMLGLPGDFTPPSRFVRAAVFGAAAIPSATHEKAVMQLFHILNQFDIPVGASREEQNGVTYTDYTMLTVVRDPQTLKFYFKTYDDQNIRFVDLNKFDLNSREVKLFSTKGVAPAQELLK